MNIIWKGKNYLRINTKTSFEDQITIAINPLFRNKKGFLGKVADIILLTPSPQGMKNNSFESGPVADDGFLISEPGEYEIKGVYIRGISSRSGNIIYTVESEDLKVCYLDSLHEKEVNSEQLERVGDVDVLVVSLNYGKSIENIANFIKQIDPKIVLPIGYSAWKNNGIEDEPQELKAFLKTTGQRQIIPQDRLSIKKKGLLEKEGETQIILLKPK